MLMRCSWMLGLAAGLIAAMAGRAETQEYCVACSEPAAVYRCVIEGARPGGAQSLQMLCITTLAKEGGHASCAIKRGTVFDCDGKVKRVPWAGLEAPAQAQGSDVPAAKPESAPDEPPKTIVEMAKRANEQTAEQVKKAGENIGNATKKSWNCLTSLFKEC